MLNSKIFIKTLFYFGIITSSLFSQTPVAPSVGDGSAESPYQIGTLENLFWIAADETRWNYYYYQTEDINAAETKNWFGGQGWRPIGNTSVKFTRVYNGGGKRIDSLFINRTSTDTIGLFRVAGSTSIIDSLGLTNI